MPIVLGRSGRKYPENSPEGNVLLGLYPDKAVFAPVVE
jgi:hypothetical protein